MFALVGFGAGKAFGSAGGDGGAVLGGDELAIEIGGAGGLVHFLGADGFQEHQFAANASAGLVGEEFLDAADALLVMLALIIEQERFASDGGSWCRRGAAADEKTAHSYQKKAETAAQMHGRIVGKAAGLSSSGTGGAERWVTGIGVGGETVLACREEYSV